MKSIEERAQIAGQVYQFCKERIEADHKVYEKGYIQGAFEQKELDEKEFEKMVPLIQRDQYLDDKESFFYATYEWMKGRYSEDELKEFVKFVKDYEKH